MLVQLCDNCDERSGLERVRVVLGPEPDVDACYALDHWVCGGCAACLKRLDIESFVERHRSRPRALDLR